MTRPAFFARQAAVERIDPELAKVFFVQSPVTRASGRVCNLPIRPRSRRSVTFLAASRTVFTRAPTKGNYGAKMRNIIAAEYRTLEDIAKLARKQNITTAVAVIALAGAVYGAVASAASTAAVVTTSGTLLAGPGWAAAQDTQDQDRVKGGQPLFPGPHGARVRPADVGADGVAGRIQGGDHGARLCRVQKQDVSLTSPG